MDTEITDTLELETMIGTLNTQIKDLDNSYGDLSSLIATARDYDGIDVTTAGRILRSNLSTLSSDLRTAAGNIKGYSNGIKILDFDDFSFSNIMDGISSLISKPINAIGNIFSNNTTVESATTPPTTPEEKREMLRKQTRNPNWDGEVLTKQKGTVHGPNGNKETFYNMDMSGVVKNMKNIYGIDGDYWVRDDGVKMYGDYIMTAANLDIYPRGSLVETSLGTAMVCDTGGYVSYGGEWTTNFDIATTWGDEWHG